MRASTVTFSSDACLPLSSQLFPWILALLLLVIGELGMHGMDPQGQGSDRVLAMRAAQHSVTLLDEFVNTTLFVRTAPYAVLNGTSYNGIYHYNGRADTYFYIGQAMGQGMLHLLGYDTPSAHVPNTKATLESTHAVGDSAIS
jgi:hypothetical protein